MAPAVIRHGIILPDKHPTDPSLLKVYFGDKTANSDGTITGGIWCINGMGSYTRFLDINNTPISYGSFIPLLPWTPVKVSFANGGQSSPEIVGFTKTNTSIPDPDNVDNLHVIHKSPNGSMIAVDNKTGNVQIAHKKGEASIVLADDIISMEVSTGGDKSGKKTDTSFSLSKGTFQFKTRDGVMKFDESGFFVGNDGDGAYLKITKDGIEMHATNFIKASAKETLTFMGKEITLEGTKDVSLRANQMRIAGTQLMNINGGHISMEAIFNVRIKGQHIGTEADILHTTDAPVRLTNIPTLDVKNVGIYAEKSTTHTVATEAWALGASTIYADGVILTNMGFGTSVSNASHTNGTAATTIAVTANKLLTKATTMKEGAIAASLRVLTDTMAGTAKTSQEATGNKSNARDKDDEQTLNTAIMNKRDKTDAAMDSVSTVSNLLKPAERSFISNSGEYQFNNRSFSRDWAKAQNAQKRRYAPAVPPSGGLRFT